MMMAVNLGTRGVADACNLLEYCNHPGGTKYSDLRIRHGCERSSQHQSCGVWEMRWTVTGRSDIKTMDEYGRLSQETAKAMKLIDPYH